MRFEDAVKKNVLAVADAYCRATELSETTVSGRFHGKNDFLRRLRAGDGGVGIEKVGEMLRAFAELWPPKTPWPTTARVSMRRPRVKRGRGKLSPSKVRAPNESSKTSAPCEPTMPKST